MTRENRQDLATAWDACRIDFQIPSERFQMTEHELSRLCDRLTWPANWTFRGVGMLAYHGTSETYWVLQFNVMGPPRAADGAYVRAKLNLIPKIDTTKESDDEAA